MRHFLRYADCGRPASGGVTHPWRVELDSIGVGDQAVSERRKGTMSMLRRIIERRIALRDLHTLVWAACALSLVADRSAHAAQPHQPTPERIAISDNRIAAGNLASGTLTIRLEARSGEWRPDREDGPGVIVNAFAIEGRAMQIPAPLIRVTEGTEIRLRS